MVSYGDVRRWRDEPLHDSVGRLNALCNTLVGLSDESSDARKTYRRHGEAAGAAATHLRDLDPRLEDMVSDVAAMRTAMGPAADTVTGLRHGIAEAETLASTYYLHIEDNGSLRDTASFNFPSEQDNDLFNVVNRCLSPFGGVGANVVGLAEAARAGGDAGHLSMLEPPQGGTAAANSAWWATLGEAGKQWILANHPEWIGNLDGVPAHYRDLANRARVPGERARLQAERDKLAAELKHYQDNPPMTVDPADQRYGQLLIDLEAVDAKIKSLDEIGKTLDQGGRQLLVLDMSGERAKAAIGIGDIDEADDVAVFTPGVDSTVDGKMAGYDNDLRELKRETEIELRLAGRGGESVAAVSWLNYEPPNKHINPQDALSDGKAYEGAARLAPFLEGINTSRPDDPHLTALGHSYGSLTTGIALRDHGTGVDEMVVFGSLGLEVDNATRLHVPQGHVYNMQAEGDWFVADVAPYFHGPNVSDVPGIRQLSTDAYTTPDGRHFEASHGHSEYNRAGTRTPPANGTWPTSSPAPVLSIDRPRGAAGDEPIREPLVCGVTCGRRGAAGNDRV